MKKVILLLAISSLLTTLLFAQVSPGGMNYQAVARNLKGEILPNQPVSLKVSLFSVQSSGKVEYYNEVHNVTTSVTGVFSLIIGGGTPARGSTYHTIPWSTQNIWMEVAIKSSADAAYLVTSSSKLLAVPYAYHAMTADRLAGTNGNNATSPGNPSGAWQLAGNSTSNPANDKLGTTDSIDIKIVTNNIERMRIFGNGNININKNVRINAKLTVDSSTFLNQIGGSTINYGPFTVDRQSPTLLSGILTVDRATDLNSTLNVDGATDLNSRLNVNYLSPTLLTGTLRVNGITDLNSALNVNNISPTLLTGTLQVNRDALYKERLKIESTYQTDTSGLNPSSGALEVGGGASIAKNLYVGGIAKFGGPAAFGGAVTISDLTQSTSTTTGALKIAGGVGIGRRLNVKEGGLFESTLGVAGITSLTNTTQATASNNGALVVTGGAGIAGNLFTGGTLTSAGAAQINNTLSVNGAGDLAPGGYIANFRNTTGVNGINIQVKNASTAVNNSNDFITFRNDGGTIVGRIEGETLEQLRVSPDHLNTLKAYEYAVATGSINVAIAGLELAQASVGIAAAASSSTACIGLGACITAPIPSLIIHAGTTFVMKLANTVSQALSLTAAVVSKNDYKNNKESSVGVTYQSGSADYAEWLPKANPSDAFKAGSVVGIKNGRISLTTAGADKIFVISTKPIVLGNMPPQGHEASYEKVAFMGQVPVFVFGKVNMGDYILPTGNNDGLAKAISPDKMKPEDYVNIVGVAWSASENGTFSEINVAIGLNTNDVSKLVSAQSKEIADLKSHINETNSILAKLVPGFKEATGVTPSDVAVSTPAVHAQHIDAKGALIPEAKDIVYIEVTRPQIDAMFAMAEKLFVENGGDLNTDPFWKMIKTEAGFKEKTIQALEVKLKHAIHMHQTINAEYLHGK